MSPAKVLVLGSNSFSGATFVDFLLERGHDVIGCSRSPEPADVFLPYKWQPRAGSFRFFQYDLNRDLDALLDLIDRERPPYVVNFAAQSMVAESWANLDHWFMTNVVSTVRFHDHLRKRDFLEKYVHVTTPEVYGSTSGFVTEDAPFNPSTPYAVSRAAADMSLRTFFANYGFPVAFTRAANVFGPGQRLYRIVPRTILFIRLGRKIQLHGGGYSERSFIHARDVAAATSLIMQQAPAGEAFHISTNRMIRIRELVQMICNGMNASFDDVTETVGERAGKDAAYRLDSSKLRSTLGWSDRITLEQGIDETIAWVDRNLEVLKQQPFDYIHQP
ncbi:MAG: GDP-mannose 4,6-dehydratase [Thermoanaerobaculia bacterium]